MAISAARLKSSLNEATNETPVNTASKLYAFLVLLVAVVADLLLGNSVAFPAELASLPATESDGLMVYVRSVDSFYTLDRPSVAVPDGNLVIAAAGGGNYIRWSYRSLFRTAWFVNQATGHDYALGGSGNPLASVNEVFRRIGAARGFLPQAVNILLQTPGTHTEAVNADFLAENNSLVSIIGLLDPGALTPATPTAGPLAVTAVAAAGAGSVNDGELVLTIGADWTAFIGQQLQFSSGGNVYYAYLRAVSGGNKIRVTAPARSASLTHPNATGLALIAATIVGATVSAMGNPQVLAVPTNADAHVVKTSSGLRISSLEIDGGLLVEEGFLIAQGCHTKLVATSSANGASEFSSNSDVVLFGCLSENAGDIIVRGEMTVGGVAFIGAGGYFPENGGRATITLPILKETGKGSGAISAKDYLAPRRGGVLVQAFAGDVAAYSTNAMTALELGLVKLGAGANIGGAPTNGFVVSDSAKMSYTSGTPPVTTQLVAGTSEILLGSTTSDAGGLVVGKALLIAEVFTAGASVVDGQNSCSGEVSTAGALTGSIGILAGNSGIGGVTRTGAGVYTVTPRTSPGATAPMFRAMAHTTDRTIGVTYAAPTFTVSAVDNAGAAADVAFRFELAIQPTAASITATLRLKLAVQKPDDAA